MRQMQAPMQTQAQMQTGPKDWVNWLLAALAVAAFGHGGWIFAKAKLAQILIARAWTQAQTGAKNPRPWPWADTYPVARLVSTRHDVELYVLAGASGRTLAFGPGLLEGAARPGEIGNTVLAGHRDTHFAFLEHVVVGDSLILETADGRSYRYVVEGTAIRDHLETDLIRPEPDQVLTLITCYPFNTVVPGGPSRFVVRARSAALRPP